MAVASKMTIYHKDQQGKRNSENWHTPLQASNIDSSTAVAIANWARSMCQALTYDNYEDVVITSTVSINEQAAE